MFAEKLYRFAIDRVNGRFISGWCFNRLRKAGVVMVTVAGDDQVLGSVSNTKYRKDLKEKKLHPTGVCGFDFSFPADFDPRSYQKINVFFDRRNKAAAGIDCRDISVLKANPGTRIFFMHIPKTAGTSFNDFARTCFAQEHYRVHIERLPVEEQMLAARTCNYVAGHVPWCDITRLGVAERFNLYALLREPYAHLHSHLNYVRRVYRDARHEAHYDFRHNETIRNLGRRLSAVDFSNLEASARFVAGLDGFEREFFDNLQTRYFLDYRPARVTEFDLERVEKTIARFQMIGLTEQYDHFRERFCLDIGVASHTQALQLNKSDSYRLFDPAAQEVREVFKPLVTCDIRLYEMVQQAFSW